MRGKRWKARAPAKINLSLRVLGRRPDGYHQLDTVFQTIDLRDRLSVEPADRLTLTCDEPAIPLDEGNLVLRAAELLAREHGGPRRRGARFHLEKSIPVGGGLGGGSSDAAAALLLAARLWSIDLPRAALLALARRLGADVPFFLFGGTARGLERGDRIEPLDPWPATPLLLGLPPFGISTAEVFRRFPARLTLPGIGVNLRDPSAHKVPAGKDFRLAMNDLENDLEDVVYQGWPVLREFRDGLLEAGARRALLSGSGSTVYGVFDDDGTVNGAARRLRPRFVGWKLIAARTVDAIAEPVACGGESIRPGD